MNEEQRMKAIHRSRKWYRNNREYALKKRREHYLAYRKPLTRKFFHIDPNELKTFYWGEKLTLTQIGKIKGVTASTIKSAMVKHGIPRRKGNFESGENHRLWKGGRNISSKGYVRIWVGGRQKYVFEHQVVWEKVHKKKLPKDWTIHHLNGIKSDNRPENLIGLPSTAHREVIPALQQRIKELEQATL